MSVSKQQSDDFLAKMKEKAATKPVAPLALVKEASVQAAPVQPMKKRTPFSERTMSFKLAEVDYDAVDDVIFKRKRAGEKGLTNKDVGREMVADWLKKHGMAPFDYSDNESAT
jgi:hypothetical protein